jgi:flagellar biosynthesis protein FlhG
LTDQAQRLRDLAAGRGAVPAPSFGGPGRVVAVSSGKGGVGKTTVVANLASLLAGRGFRVTVLDADFGLANLDIVLNLNPRRNLGHLLRGEARADEVVVEVSPGLRVIPGASGIEALADLEAGQRQTLFSSLSPLTAGSDFLLLDTSAGIGRNVVDLCAAASEVVLVTNPEPTSLTDAYGLLKVLLGKRPEAVARLLVNSVRGADEARAVHGKLAQVVERFLGASLPYLGHVERDDCVARATQRQIPFVSAYPRSRASRCLASVADLLAAESGRGNGTGGFWRRLLGVKSGEG